MADNEKRGAAPPTSAPAPAGADAAKAASGISRRQFLRTGMYGTVGMAFGSVLVGGGVMMWPAKVSGFGGKVPAPVRLSELKPGDPPVKVREGKYWLSRVPEGLIALYWKCVHLGCTVPWNEGEQLFHCPCHGSIYDRTGHNVGGPAPRPLDYMEIELDGENITVDTGKIVKRERHLPEHITRV